MGSLVAAEEERSEIVFFDLETTIPPYGFDRPYAISEFGSIFVCPKTLTELDSYDSLVKPLNLSLITPKSVSKNHISAKDVENAPTFSEIADRVYDILHGRVWIYWGLRIKEAYAEINRPPPVPKAIIDTCSILEKRFGRERAGDLKEFS